MPRSKKYLRKRGAINKAVGLVRSGMGRANISKLSTPVLEGVLSKESKNTPLARSIGVELAGRPRVARKRKRGSVKVR